MRSLAPLRLFSVGIPNALKITPQHFRMHDVRVLLGEGFFDYCFTIVRDPFARAESEFRLRATLGGNSFWKGFSTFSMWLEESLQRQQREPAHYDNHLRAQWEFIGSGVTVFRYEDSLETIIGTVAARLGVAPPAELSREFETQSSKIDVTWDLADRMRVQEHYRRDFEQFGYPTEVPLNQAS